MKENSQRGHFLFKSECHLKYQYILALQAYNQTDFNKTIDITTSIIENYNMEFEWLKGFAYFLRAKSYDLMDQRILAIDDYNQVFIMDDFYPEVGLAREYIKKPFSLN